MPTILSRFDTIFIVKDEHNEKRDMVIFIFASMNWLYLLQLMKPCCFYLLKTLAKHVMGIHMNSIQTGEEAHEGELSLSLLKKYIGFCRR